MKKRLSALLLVLVMTLALLPSTFAVTADTETSYQFNFMRLRYGEWSNSAYHPHQVTSWGWEELSENFHNYATAPYRFFGKSEGATWSWQPASANLPEFGPYFTGTPGEWVGWTLRTATSGYFIPSVTFAGVSNGGNFDVYLAPIGVSDPMAEEYYIGQMNTYASKVTYQQNATMNTVALPAGDYSFIMKISEGQSSATQWVSAVTLTPTAGDWLDVTFDAVSLNKEETPTATVALPSDWDTYTVISQNPSVATAVRVGNSITIQANATGTASVYVFGTKGSYRGGSVIPVTVTGATAIPSENVAIKTRTTYITEQKRAAAQENIKKYDWAKSQAQNMITAANRFVDDWDWLWNFITSQDLPRGAVVTGRNDPDMYNCHYCGTNLSEYTSQFYPWLYDVVNSPWKIKCPACAREFPSNDFSKFYEAGINEHGWFDYQKAKTDGAKYLTNDLYPEKGTGWGVDDGYGYVLSEKIIPQAGYAAQNRIHSYIAYYNHWAVWYGGSVRNILGALGHAYVYTGDLKYGRAGAIMLDRIADVYPDMYVGEYFPLFLNSDFGTPRGRIVGGIWETGMARDLAMYYDFFFPAYDDAEVVKYLAAKAETYSLSDARNDTAGGVGNNKSTPKLIRQNIENGLLREIIDGVRVENKIYGNQGMHQSTATMAAVVLDSPTETTDTLNWVMGSGGNVTSDLLSTINRDGQGDEAAPGYSDTWISSYSGIVDALESYDGYSGASLYDNPKFVKLVKTNLPLTLIRSGTAPIGDSGCLANKTINVAASRLIPTFLQTKDVEIGQFLYFLNGNSPYGIQADIFTPATDLASEIKKIIDTHGEYPFDESDAMTGSFSFYALRDGTLTDTKNTQRDFWMYFGRTTNHGHPAVLNIGMDAYGVPMLSDFGYPENTLGIPRTLNWDTSTIIHNTVQVNDTPQSEVTTGTALHFDGDNNGRVQIMDARNTAAYSATSEFRRTTVMVDFDESVSYGVDFFRVTGGNTHTFALHPVSNTEPTAEGLTFTKQTSGTYAGPGVAYGNYAKTSGYDGFYDVSHATPSGVYSLDYKINNFRSFNTGAANPHLKITQLSDFTPTQVSIASAEPPKNSGNPSMVKSLLVKRTGSSLDSLFTTVLQPYDTTPYIAKSEVVPITLMSGTPASTDKAYAVKVTMKNGRVDYIVYATNNTVTYRVDDKFDFCGFVGVMTYEDGINTYSYLSHGTRIGDLTHYTQYSGTVRDFTKTLSFDNSITVTSNTPIDVDEVRGRYMFVNGNTHSYQIKNATENADGTYTFDIGDFSLVTGTSSYEIAAGNSFTIPVSKEYEYKPVELKTVNGAQIRTTGAQGLRFISTIDKSAVDFENVVEYGTVLIPTADLDQLSDLKIGATLKGHTVAKVPAKNIYAEDESTITFTAVITNIAQKNFAREYTARAYAIMENGSVVYGDTSASRSVYAVAKKGLEVGTESEEILALFAYIVDAVENYYGDNDASWPWE
ncbi:MAG: heparinase II/III family protein [Oscillospiraceae bacterium]|nr:heparinase II/III family protein [Oscillospiraceae bacterium]